MTNCYHTFAYSLVSKSGSSIPATRFVFEVTGNSMSDILLEEINGINTKSKAMDRISSLYESNCQLKYKSVPNSIFRGNLWMIDSNMPNILGWLLQDCYRIKNLDINAAVERAKIVNPLNYELDEGHDQYGYKIKALIYISINHTHTFAGEPKRLRKRLY